MAGSMRYRLRVGSPDSDSIEKFASAMSRIQAISDNRGFAAIGGLHGAPSWYCWHHQFNRRSDNRAQVFLPWHRAYLYHLELSLNDLQADGAVALPWWDWSRQRAVPDAYAVATIGGEDSPLRRFRMNLDLPSGSIRRFTRREPGQNPFVTLPSQADVDAALGDADWSSISDALEELHDSVHVWVGGDMADITTAGFDPIFYAHHAMVDRLWYLWQIRHGINTLPADLLDFVLDPFAVTVRDVLDTRSLGYEYADELAPIAPAEPELVA